MFCFLFLSFYFLTVFVLCFISERFCFYPSMRFAALLYALWLEYFFGDHVWRENCLLFLLFLGAYIFSFVNVFIIFIFFLCCFARVLASLVEIVLLLVFEGNVIDGIHAFVWSSRLWILGCFCFLYSRVMKWIWFITSFWVLLFFFCCGVTFFPEISDLDILWGCWLVNMIDLENFLRDKFILFPFFYKLFLTRGFLLSWGGILSFFIFLAIRVKSVRWWVC